MVAAQALLRRLRCGLQRSLNLAFHLGNPELIGEEPFPHLLHDLRPLRWIAQEDLVYHEVRNELHKPSCPLGRGSHVEMLGGESLELVWAPKICPRCRPDVRTGRAL